MCICRLRDAPAKLRSALGDVAADSAVDAPPSVAQNLDHARQSRRVNVSFDNQTLSPRKNNLHPACWTKGVVGCQPTQPRSSLAQTIQERSSAPSSFGICASD